MAYTELVSSGQVPVAGGATYQFSFDSPVAADGSPHISNFGIQLNQVAGAAITPSNGLGGLISRLRVQFGSSVVFDYNTNAAAAGGVLSQLSCLVQRLGGSDYSTTYDVAAANDDLGCVSQLVWPLGLPANKSHRVNVILTLGDESPLLNGGGANQLVPGQTEINVVCEFGTSTEQTVVGASQGFTMTASGSRILTIYGKQNYNMLGVFAASAASTQDNMSSARINNGAFRELSVTQWRGLNNAFDAPDRTSLRLGATGPMAADGSFAAVGLIAAQAGSTFMNLRRLTAGANIDIMFTYSALGGDAPLNLIPVYVAPVNAKSGPAPRQTVITPQSTTKTVEANTAN